ncbi:DUF4157 domain-containing protein [Halogeometricum sp. CBA1124]|uniref:eCIS core domain-containing protein n=1 Tax=Halogeometricum sp. CBA1124 TaxID=2668071 RepID=UPI00142CC964|nr:DUF4157 domain-containing protein [Halogeometricum sp. CBA1124]MUV56378.1 DUF4157 domain-containing protein [Halogeometricum sp. CBA1124]
MTDNLRAGADSTRTSETETADRRRGRAEGSSDHRFEESPVSDERAHPFELLQRDWGNRAVQGLVERQLQRKPLVGRERGRHELEAERWAEAARRGDRVQRNGEPSRTTGSVPGEAPVGSDVASYVEQSRDGGTPIPHSIRTTLERQFGTGLGDVRIHAGTDAADASRRADARAFTVGRDVHFGAGEYRPSSTGGRELLAHELAHVVQQRSSSDIVQRVPEGESPVSGTGHSVGTGR